MSSTDSEAGIHARTEDETIFVTEAALRLGAETEFTGGTPGLRFANFRATRLGLARSPIDAAAFGHEQFPPQYVVA